jgi:sensor histidine kinase YesM
MPLHHAIQAGILDAALIVAFGSVAFRLTRRYPPVALGAVTVAGRQVLMAHAKAALALGVAATALQLGNSWVMGYLFPSVDQIRVVKAVTSTIGGTASYTLMYGFLAVLAYGVEYARRYRQARTAARRLTAELNEVGRRRAVAELCALKAELNPHFLGNALHTVSALARVNPDAAERVLTQLGELLRTAVTHSRTHEVPLREELETLEPFLAIAQARLGRRLEVDWDVDDTLLEARVPHMILQPLVENAVKHGLSPQERAGHIAVVARKRNNRLELSVRDDGVGLPQRTGHSCAFERCGVGLANTRARLAEMYGSAATFELMSGDRGGTVARLSLPWRDTAAPFAMGL